MDPCSFEFPKPYPHRGVEITLKKGQLKVKTFAKTLFSHLFCLVSHEKKNRFLTAEET
jgi:hypothetical protein